MYDQLHLRKSEFTAKSQKNELLSGNIQKKYFGISHLSFDTGPLVKQKQLCFPFGWSAADLSTYLAEEGAALVSIHDTLAD